MQFFTPILAALVALAAAQQDLDGVPSCAKPCFPQNLADSGCDATDVVCQCKSTAYLGDVESCVSQKCDATDMATTMKWAQTTCQEAGAPIGGS